MLQRLGLAQALLGSPEVLVLDEPASGLDPVGQRDIRNLMLELKEQGATILLSSHQLSEVETVSDEVTILNRGRVAARGHIDDLLNVAGETSIAARGDGRPACRASPSSSETRPFTATAACSRSPTSTSARSSTRSTMAAGGSCRSAPSGTRSRTTSRGFSASRSEAPDAPGVADPSGGGRAMKKMLAIAAAVVADAIRRKVVWVVLVFAVFLGSSIPALPSYGVGVAASVFREVAIALTYVAALVVALALSATRIPVEVERRTVFNVISRDVRRWQYVAGRWLGHVRRAGRRHRAVLRWPRSASGTSRCRATRSCGACLRRRSPCGSRSASSWRSR